VAIYPLTASASRSLAESERSSDFRNQDLLHWQHSVFVVLLLYFRGVHMTAFPDLFSVPANVNAQLNYSISSTYANPLLLSFAPTDANGGLFDLTNATSYTLNLDNGQQGGTIGYVANAVTCTKVSGTTTGGSLSVTAADIKTAIIDTAGENNSASGRLSISATDGTNTVMVARGTWNYQQGA
jgi:hypothetical protein